MIRRAFVSRMAFAAICSGMLGWELLGRAPKVESEPQWLWEPGRFDGNYEITLEAGTIYGGGPGREVWIELERRFSPEWTPT